MTQPNPEIARKRAYRYQFEDGLVEIAQGGAFALIGLFVWLISSLTMSKVNKLALVAGFLVFAVVLTIAIGVLIDRYKKRVTYPRTGRVDYQPQAEEEMRSGAVIIVVALLIAAAAIWLDGWYVTTTTIVGATLTLISLPTALRAGILRMQLAALLPLLISLVAAFVGIDETLGAAIVLAGSGLVTLALGLGALMRYLRNNPESEDED